MIEVPKTMTEGFAFIEKYSLNKQVEGHYRVGDCIADIEKELDSLMQFGNTYANPKFRTRVSLYKWISRNVKHSLKSTPMVFKYFIDKYEGMVVFRKNTYRVTTLSFK